MARRFDEIDAALANPSGAFDQARFTALVKERAQLEEPVETYRRLRRAREIAANERSLASEGELRDLAEDENGALPNAARTRDGLTD